MLKKCERRKKEAEKRGTGKKKIGRWAKKRGETFHNVPPFCLLIGISF